MKREKEILIVDNQPDVAHATGEMLCSFGYQTKIASGSEEAYELATGDNTIDLILMETDLETSGAGIETARKILKDCRLPIVFYTDSTDQETIENVRGISRYGYVLKSGGEHVLRDAVETAFELFECDRKLRNHNRQLTRKNKQISTLKEKYRLLFESANDAIFLHEIGGEKPGKFREVNHQALDSLQYSRDELLEMNVMQISPEEEQAEIPGKLKSLLEHGRGTFESAHKRKDGTVFPVEISAQVVNLAGEELILAVVRDISERKEVEKRLQDLAVKDSLTGLFNRQLMFEKLGEEMQRSNRFGHPLSVLMIDLDNFKRINDKYGHLCGDTVLRYFGGLIRDELREFDIPIRFGGEEFCVILPETDLDSASTVGKRIREKISQQKFRSRDGTKYSITCSIGSARLQAGDDYDALLNRADNALYQAKARGKDCLERRQHMRLKVNPREVKIKVDDGWETALLLDHSRRGVQLETAVDVNPAQQVKVDLNGKKIPGEVRWVAGGLDKFSCKTGIELSQDLNSFGK